MLPYSPPQLQDNYIIVILIILFAVVDLLACHPKGIMVQQFMWLTNTRNARTFEGSSTAYPWLLPLLYIQLFLFFGMTLFCCFDPAPASHFLNPDSQSLQLMAACLFGPIVLYLAQRLCYNWFCFLFRMRFQQIIMNRTYQASTLLLAPLATIIFIGIMSSSFTDTTTLILLAGLFILSQLLFVFSGFKIFLTSFSSFLAIIAYLCTLEIAPLWVLWTKITT